MIFVGAKRGRQRTSCVQPRGPSIRFDGVQFLLRGNGLIAQRSGTGHGRPAARAHDAGNAVWTLTHVCRWSFIDGTVWEFIMTPCARASCVAIAEQRAAKRREERGGGALGGLFVNREPCAVNKNHVHVRALHEHRT